MAEGTTPGRDVVRLAAFTDGVIVVSLTLLALDVRLPEDMPDLNDAALLKILGEMWPKYFGYVVSFLVVANIWIAYTSRFQRLKGADGGFVWLNMFFLLLIGFVPFATSVLSENDGRVATTLYAATMAVCSALLGLMGLYAERRNLIDRPPGHDSLLRQLIPAFTVAGVFAFSIVIAQFDASLAKYSWLLLFVTGFLGRRRRALDPSSS